VAIIERIRRGERVDHFETVRRRKDGIVFPVSLTISPILAKDGQIIGASKIARDVSERHQAQVKLQNVQSELFHVSRLNTISHMASGLAHELNQPLSAIANYLKGAQRLLGDRTDELSTTVQKALAEASEQAMRAGQIVRRLRDFMSHGETEFRVENVSQLVNEASQLALSDAKDRVKVQFGLDSSIEVLIDKIQIQQVLLNLLRNAFEAMESVDRRELTITATAADAQVEISVKDTGPGIAENVAAQLFQPFVTTKGHGMGVGLSISKTIIEAHGGRIWIEPNPAGGTIFRFTLPLASESDEQV
jgi:two-component system, LuxR family, sensor kinase FixL